MCNSLNNPDDDLNGPLLPSPGVPSLPERDNEQIASCQEISDDKDQCFEKCVLKALDEPLPLDR